MEQFRESTSEVMKKFQKWLILAREAILQSL